MKTNILFILSLAIIISCTEVEQKQTVESYLAAHNSHDIEKAMSYYDENAVFELKGVWVKQGLTEMRLLEEFDASMNSHLELKSITAKVDSVFCKLIEKNDWLENLGITELVHDPVIMIVNQGKIKRIIAHPSQENMNEINAAIGSVYEWSKINQDSTVHELIINNQFIYGNKTANKWRDLFKRMQASNSLE